MVGAKVATSFNCIVGAVVQHHRKERCTTQAQFAKALGLTQSAYSRLERGVTPFSIPQLMRAAEALQISPVALLDLALRAQEALRARGVPVVDDVGAGGSADWLTVSPSSLQELVAPVLLRRGRRSSPPRAQSH